MGWSIGFDSTWNRDVGYGVPATCDHPDCNEEINRGLSYVCCDQEPYGGDGCGLFFCSKHRKWASKPDDDEDDGHMMCERCGKALETGEPCTPFDAKPDHRDWIRHKLTDESWQKWRDESPEDLAKLRAALG